MKVITKEEAAAQFVTSRGRQSHIRTAIEALEVGQVLQLEKKDVPTQRGPYEMVRRMMKKSKKRWQASTIRNGSGWLVERLA